MNTIAGKAASTNRTSKWQRLGPILTLLLAAPVVSELLSGSVRITTLFILIPTTGVWGCAALLIRELAHRRGRTWRSVLMLGLALAVAEECVIQQTSLAPLVGMKPSQVYARAFGVNWEYFLWALGFESVWAVVLPIGLAEYLFPERRHEPWLKARGLTIATMVLILSSFAAWYSWTQVYLPKYFPDSVYHPPWSAFAIALVVIAVLVITALVPKVELGTQPLSDLPAPHVLLVELVAFAIALPWYSQILVAFNGFPRLPVAVALAVGIALAAVAIFVAQRWSIRRSWTDARTLAAILGIIIATLVGGYFSLQAGQALMIDRVGQVLFTLATIAALVLHGRKTEQAQHIELG